MKTQPADKLRPGVRRRPGSSNALPQEVRSSSELDRKLGVALWLGTGAGIGIGGAILCC